MKHSYVYVLNSYAYAIHTCRLNLLHLQYNFINMHCYFLFIVGRFESQLELPQLPEMIFADNILHIEHSSGFGIQFTALDALKCVDAHHDHIKVAVSQAWKEARYVLVYFGKNLKKEHIQAKTQKN